MAPPIAPTISLLSAIPLVLLGGALLWIRPRRADQLFFGFFAILWGLQASASNLGLVLEDPRVFEVGFLLANGLAPPAALFLAGFVARTSRGRWTWLLPVGLGAIAAVATLVLILEPSLVLEGVSAAPDGTIGAVELGPMVGPLFVVPFFGTFYLALLVLYRRYREAAPGSSRHRYRGMVLALGLFTSYHAVTNLSIFLDLFDEPALPAGTEAWLTAGPFLVGTLLLAGLVAHLALRPPRPEGRDGALLAAFLVPAGVALVTELTPSLGEAWRSWGLWRLLMVALLVHAVARYQLFDLDLRLKRVAGPTLAGLVLALGAVASLALGLDGRGPLASAWPVIAGLGGGGALVLSRDAVGQALFPAASEEESYLRQRKREVYAAALERVIVDQDGDPDDPVLASLRESLGIPDADHEALAFRLSRSGGASTAAEPELGPVSPGRTVAERYRVDRVLGEGAHGRAVLAYDGQADREVVLKVVGTAVLGGRAATLLEREAGILARLEHPNVVEVHDVLEGPREIVLVLEHVDGGSIAGLLKRRGSRGLREATRILDEVLAGLAAAHEAGVVHRDLKPSNLLRTRDGQVKLADFGVAHEPGAGATVMTAGPVGTLLYMSPEQVRGAEVDARSDLYAVGVLFHQLLTGRLPMRTAGEDDFGIRRQILEAPPTLAVDDHPPWVRAFLERALAKDPDDRFPSAEEMRQALGSQARELATVASA